MFQDAHARTARPGSSANDQAEDLTICAVVGRAPVDGRAANFRTTRILTLTLCSGCRISPRDTRRSHRASDTLSDLDKLCEGDGVIRLDRQQLESRSRVGFDDEDAAQTKPRRVIRGVGEDGRMASNRPGLHAWRPPCRWRESDRAAVVMRRLRRRLVVPPPSRFRIPHPVEAPAEAAGVLPSPLRG